MFMNENFAKLVESIADVRYLPPSCWFRIQVLCATGAKSASSDVMDEKLAE